jgi:hypothetical protein
MRRTALTGMAMSVVLSGGLSLATSAQDETTTIEPCTTDAVRVTGKIIWGELDHEPTVYEPGDGSQHIRDFVFLSRMKADDGRLEGATTATIDWDFYGLDGKPRERAGVNRGSFHVEGTDGSWEGPWTGVGVATDSWRARVDLTGAGGYEGLSATLFVRSGQNGPISGTIYPSDLLACDYAVTA